MAAHLIMSTSITCHADEKVVLITGAASGIGLAIGKHLSALGHVVYLTDVNSSAIDKAAAHLTKEGLAVYPVALDVTDESAISNVIARIRQEQNRLDILINNAGMQHVAQLENFPGDKWKQLIDVMLSGPALLVKAALPMMRQEDFGRIVNIGSIHSLVASPYKSAYIAAKHGLLGFSKTIALETADQNITINTLCPSYVKTPLVDQQIVDQARENNIPEEQVINDIMLAPMPKKSFIELEEICGAVDFLISDSARNMTGQQLVLDGGWTCR